MLSVLGTALAGIGLFFYGMKLVGNELRSLSGRRIRHLFSVWSKNIFVSIIAGFFSGAITQSTSNASLIITNLVASRLISVRNAIPVIAASNIGTVLLVFLVVVNIKLAALYLLGITAVLYSLNKKIQKKPIAGVILGIGIILFGFNTFVSEARVLFNAPEIKESLLVLKNEYLYYVLPFLVGLVLRFLSQSTSTVSVIGISLCQTGIIDINQTLLIVFGAPLGSVATLLLYSKGFRGAAKQITYFQMLFETLGTVIFTLILSVELVFDISILRLAIEKLSQDMPGQVAFALLFMRIVPFLVTLGFKKRIEALIAKLSPISTEEQLVAPMYIYDGAIEEPQTAMDLLEKEQLRLIERYPVFVENIRTEHEISEVIDYEILHTAHIKLQSEINDFIKEMFGISLGYQASERLVKLQNLQNYSTQIEENLYQFIKEVSRADISEKAYEFINKIIESLHLVLTMNLEMNQPDSIGATIEVRNLTSDKEKLMESMRKPFLSENNGFSQIDKAVVLSITNLFQRIVWLVNQRTYLIEH